MTFVLNGNWREPLTELLLLLSNSLLPQPPPTADSGSCCCLHLQYPTHHPTVELETFSQIGCIRLGLESVSLCTEGEYNFVLQRNKYMLRLSQFTDHWRGQTLSQPHGLSQTRVTMSTECKKILIFGATGLVGSRITQEIVRNKAKFDRIAVFTSPGTYESKAAEIQALKDHGVDIIVGDVTNNDDVVKAYEGKIDCLQTNNSLTPANRHRHCGFCCG